MLAPIILFFLLAGSIASAATPVEKCVDKILKNVPYATDSELLPGITASCDDKATRQAVLKCKTAKCVEETTYVDAQD